MKSLLNYKNLGVVKVYKDIQNYSHWIRTIKKEKTNPKSKYNMWKLNHTKLYDIYLSISLDEQDVQLPENIKRVKVIESLNPLNKYLDNDLGFAECLNIDFNQFYDNEKPTLTYLIVYRFNFTKLSIIWLIKWMVIIFGIWFLIFNTDFIHFLQYHLQ